MEINTNVGGYGRTPRAYELPTKQESSAETLAGRIDRRDNALTGSNAVLSANLANALWAAQENRQSDDASLASASRNAIESSYFEFMN
ncbi:MULTISPECIES: hypothetical protein [unclassified Rhizobium]|uniref:hypothetical protein n=1 Tax=unclassified Rhizobium TaxID=2613769 RepID=UPI001600A64B|nr:MULTISPECIES: hypothetical protein [unclassified Rhizobium]MBB1249181.1 hypothetical protein [Rhizobium sp. G21]MCV3767126.1 hypothetical protein [Rhizobium sp. TRM95796]